jgi:hypothetical protein
MRCTFRSPALRADGTVDTAELMRVAHDMARKRVFSSYYLRSLPYRQRLATALRWQWESAQRERETWLRVAREEADIWAWATELTPTERAEQVACLDRQERAADHLSSMTEYRSVTDRIRLRRTILNLVGLD